MSPLQSIDIAPTGQGKAHSKTVAIINKFIDEHEAELMELWNKAQRGEKINKIR